MIRIENLDDPEIQDYVKLKKLDSSIILDGQKVINNYLKAFNELESIFVSETFLNKNTDYLNLFSCPIFYSPTEKVNEIIGYKFHNGIMAKVKKPNRTLKKLTGPCIVLNGISGPENVGMIVRNCKAFGIRNLVYDTKTADPFMRRCVRVSIGHVFGINLYPVESLSSFLNENSYDLVGTSVNGDHQCEFNEKTALILGSEGSGMDPDLVSQCYKMLKIKTVENISINVGCASAVLLSKFDII